MTLTWYRHFQRNGGLNKATLASPLFIGEPVLNQKDERSCMSGVFGVSLLSISTSVRLNFGSDIFWFIIMILLYKKSCKFIQLTDSSQLQSTTLRCFHFQRLIICLNVHMLIHTGQMSYETLNAIATTKVGILLKYREHMHDCIISMRGYFDP